MKRSPSSRYFSCKCTWMMSIKMRHASRNQSNNKTNYQLWPVYPDGTEHHPNLHLKGVRLVLLIAGTLQSTRSYSRPARRNLEQCRNTELFAYNPWAVNMSNTNIRVAVLQGEQTHSWLLTHIRSNNEYSTQPFDFINVTVPRTPQVRYWGKFRFFWIGSSSGWWAC